MGLLGSWVPSTGVSVGTKPDNQNELAGGIEMLLINIDKSGDRPESMK